MIPWVPEVIFSYLIPDSSREAVKERREASRGKMLTFSVMPFEIDQNKNQNRSIDKVQNLGNERR